VKRVRKSTQTYTVAENADILSTFMPEKERDDENCKQDPMRVIGAPPQPQVTFVFSLEPAWTCAASCFCPNNFFDAGSARAQQRARSDSFIGTVESSQARDMHVRPAGRDRRGVPHFSWCFCAALTRG